MTKFLLNIYVSRAIDVPSLKFPVPKLNLVYGGTLDNVESIVKSVKKYTKTKEFDVKISVDAALTGCTNRSVLMKYNKKTCTVYVIEIELV